MKTSTKITSIVIIFFLIIAAVIIGRTMIGNHFKKKFSKRPPPGIIVTEVVEKKFSEKIEIIFKKPSFFLVFKYLNITSFSNFEINLFFLINYNFDYLAYW